MIRLVSIVLIIVCLLTLTACRQAAPTSMIEIQDQDNEDGTIIISFAIDGAGWLVLHPATSGGDPDTSEELTKSPITGAGEFNDVEITMPEAIDEDQTFFLMLYYDDPADGKFTSADSVVEVAGEVVQDSFTVPAVPPYIEMTQNVSAGTTTIKGLTYEAGLVMVLRPSTPEGEMDTSTMLKAWMIQRAGPFSYTITTPAILDEGDILFAVLHYDDPDDGLFTYTPDGDEDLPVEVDGDIVVGSLEISD